MDSRGKGMGMSTAWMGGFQGTPFRGGGWKLCFFFLSPSPFLLSPFQL